MFTSLFQLEQKAVTVFSSADAGAPILTKDPGSLKTLLKACLVTGYGSKTPLGWQMLHESTNQLSAAFASQDPTASKYLLKIDNADSAFAKLSAYQSMTDIDNGIKPIVVNNIYTLYKSEWMLIGHSKTFLLLLDINLPQIPNKLAYPMLFGDLPRQIKRTSPICTLWSARNYGDVASGGVQPTLFYHVNGSAGKNDYGIHAAAAYPFAINNGASSEDISRNFCKFDHLSNEMGMVLYEPITSSLSDGTWTFLPMLQPTSRKIHEVANLSYIGEDGVRAITGGFLKSAGVDKENNCDCVVPTKWWYA